MLDLLIVAYIKSMIMLIGVQKVLGQELKCLYSKTTTVLGEWIIPKIIDASYIFIALEVNKFIA